jgi:hypothetical protein
MKEWIVKVDGEIESRSRDEESAIEAARMLEEEDGIQPESIEIEERDI